jgi:catechol 2,3-dioxygenase
MPCFISRFVSLRPFAVESPKANGHRGHSRWSLILRDPIRWIKETSMLGIERVGHIVLNVSDLELSTAFYRDILGMEVTSYRPGQGAFMSFGTLHHDIAIFQAKEGATKGDLGLSHLALRIPGGDGELRTAYDKLKASGLQIRSTTDHGMTHSVYFYDPDGNVLEVYTDVYDEPEGMNVMRTKVNMREPLDIEAIPAR